jgi:hypothetical protein
MVRASKKRIGAREKPVARENRAMAERRSILRDVPPQPTRHGLAPPPSAYLAQAHAAIAPAPLRPREVRVRRLSAEPLPKTYQAHEPALRLIRDLQLPHDPRELLTGMVVRLSGVADGERERLLYDLGDTAIRAFPTFAEGTLTVVFARREVAARYRSILRTLRYLNRAPSPVPGERRVVVQTVDSTGALHMVADLRFSVVVSGNPATAVEADPPPAIVDGDAHAFSDAQAYTVHWWPHRLAKPPERTRAVAVTGGTRSSAERRLTAGAPARRTILRLADVFGSEVAAAPAARARRAIEV